MAWQVGRLDTGIRRAKVVSWSLMMAISRRTSLPNATLTLPW